jgi:polyphosphate kinase
VYIGTGNLNATTAATYIDLGIMSADPRLTAEVTAVFNLLTGYAIETEWKHLLVAPFNMRRRFLEAILREAEHAAAGRPCGIRAQLNGLADRRIIDALYEASAASVPIKLTVREICALRPGLPDISESIEVRSLLGRFLQHARIFRFENGGDPEYFIGSADWRPRNLAERIEVVTPVTHPEHRAELDRILRETFDHPDAWRLRADGGYYREGQSIDPILAAEEE